MSLFGGHSQGASWARSLDPRLKLAWLAFLLSGALFSRSLTGLALVLLSCLAVGALARIPWGPLAGGAILVLLVGLQLIIVHSVFTREGRLLFTWYLVQVHSEALWTSLRALLRLSAILAACLQYYLWTQPAQLVQLLVSARIPYRYATLGGLALRFLPEMERELQAVTEAQAARGLAVDGPIARLRSLPSLAVPLIFRSLRRADDVALALELRGFGAHRRRSFREPLPSSWLQRVLACGLVVAALLLPFA